MVRRDEYEDIRYDPDDDEPCLCETGFTCLARHSTEETTELG